MSSKGTFGESDITAEALQMVIYALADDDLNAEMLMDQSRQRGELETLTKYVAMTVVAGFREAFGGLAKPILMSALKKANDTKRRS